MEYTFPGAPLLKIIQLLCGRDIASSNSPIHRVASQMSNYVYLVCDTGSNEAIAVDACWDVAGLFKFAEERGLDISKAVYTHKHFDHIGGRLPRQMTGGKVVTLEGISDMVSTHGCEVFVGAHDSDHVSYVCDLAETKVTKLQDKQQIKVGRNTVHTLHTPGHTTGSISLLIEGGGTSKALITGDTLFIGSVGRTDLPGSSQHEMLASLQKISKLNRSVLILPGHNYSPKAYSSIGAEIEHNPWMHQALKIRNNSTIGTQPTVSDLPATQNGATQFESHDMLTMVKLAQSSLHGIQHEHDSFCSCHAKAAELFSKL